MLRELLEKFGILDYPISNLEIRLIGPNVGLIDQKLIPFFKNCYVLNTGEIKQGYVNGLHTSRGEIDFGLGIKCIHWDDNTYITDLEEGKNTYYLGDDKLFYELGYEMRPKYTFKGLQKQLPKKIDRKIKRLKEEILFHAPKCREVLEKIEEERKTKEKVLSSLESMYINYVSN